MATTMNQATKPSATAATKPLKTAGPLKSAAKRTAQPTRPVAKAESKVLAKPKTEKPAMVKKSKLVRERFTIPKTEYTVLDELKQRAEKLDHKAKKSELLRAGVKALAAMPDAAFLSTINAVPAIKTGNTKNKKAK
jgi:hypothetical protein